MEIKYYGWFGRQKSIKVDIPTCWNEMSADQVAKICKLLYLQKIDIYRFRILSIQTLFGFSWLKMMLIKDRMVDLYQFIRFLEEENNLTKNPFVIVKANGIKFYGPIGDFSTLKAEEWTEADTAFMDFMASENQEDLDRFISILYREQFYNMNPDHPEWAGDYRMPFNEHTVPLRMMHLSKLDAGIKFGILTWYRACRQEWENLFERVFQSNGQNLENFGWPETIQKLSGSTFGDMAKTMDTYMYRLMLNMEITIKDEEVRKEQERIHKLKKL